MQLRSGIASSVFDVWSRFYDLPLVQRVAYRPVHDAVVGALSGSDPERILDVGCGTGLLASRLHRSCPAAVVGVDYSAGMLGEARRRWPDGGWVRGDAQVLPFADRSFDALCCVESFHWYPDQEQAAVEMARVLVPGGRAIIAHMSPLVTTSLKGRARWPSRRDVAELLVRAGFDIEHQQRVWRLPGGYLTSALVTVARRPQDRRR
jgi:ubiquinone/menaquinone biosynthesis C-methylase UbiE